MNIFKAKIEKYFIHFDDRDKQTV